MPLMACADLAIVRGTCASYSSDGTRLAFQRECGGRMRAGVLDLATRSETWLDAGPGHSAFPSWHPSGDALVYVYGNETLTAFAAAENAENTGWNLRVWRNGKIRQLDSVRVWDSTPCFSPDGRTIWFSSTRGAPKGTFSTLFSRPLKTNGQVTQILPYETSNTGASSPNISPNGKVLVWARNESFFGGSWHIALARVDAPEKFVVLTPPQEVAYSPRWSPDGKYLAYTGYKVGDEGWMVCIMEVSTGASRHLFAGRMPAFHPAGKKIVYEKDGVLYEHELTAEDFPLPNYDAQKGKESESPHTLWVVKSPSNGLSIPMDGHFAFGDSRTFFVRARVVVPQPSVSGIDVIVAGRYAEHDLGFQLLFRNCAPGVAVRNSSGEYCPVFGKKIEIGRETEIVGIRTKDALYLSVDGGFPVCRRMAGNLPLDNPRKIDVMPPYKSVSQNIDVKFLEVGVGWPSGIITSDDALKEIFK